MKVGGGGALRWEMGGCKCNEKGGRDEKSRKIKEVWEG